MIVLHDMTTFLSLNVVKIENFCAFAALQKFQFFPEDNYSAEIDEVRVCDWYSVWFFGDQAWQNQLFVFFVVQFFPGFEKNAVSTFEFFVTVFGNKINLIR